MQHLFSEDARRNPYPLYAQLRATTPAVHHPDSGLYLVFDHATVDRVLTDHDTFSSRHGPDWLVFHDPPRHARLRALISKAFTPRSVTGLEPRIREIAGDLFDAALRNPRFDFATDFAVPLPMQVIAEMLGLPPADRPRFTRWNDVLLEMSRTIPGTPGANDALDAYIAATAEMADYLRDVLENRRTDPKDDLLTRLQLAEVDGQQLTAGEILGFVQLLLLAGSETTTNLLTNAILTFLDHPDQLQRLRAQPELLPSAIEEILRFRSPLQWMYRKTTRDVTLHDLPVPAGRLVLAVIGSANHDPSVFPHPDRFDIARHPNPHLAFGHGPHFCLGAPLARLEARIALTELLARTTHFERATTDPWAPRPGLHVLGPSSLPLNLMPA